MPYDAGTRLPGERASRLGHLDVLRSPLVKKLCESFDSAAPEGPVPAPWRPLPDPGRPLPLIFAVDGSLQIIENPSPPHATLAFVKTALLRIDRVALNSIDRVTPHPLALRDLLSEAAIYHATVFPMRHIVVPGVRLYDAVRGVIFDSVSDPSLDCQILETLKWLAYEKWDGQEKALPEFQCPSCGTNSATLPYDAEQGNCGECGTRLYLTDMLGFHLEMSDDAAPDTIATSYMLVHETLLLFTGIRYFWENRRSQLSDCLFLKDGPLYIRAQYSKLVNPIRRFLEHALDSGTPVCIVGQEKSGAFYDHLQLVGPHAPPSSMFVPGHDYIRTEIQHRPTAGQPYGRDTNYGAKVFIKLDERHQAVLNIPTGAYQKDPQPVQLIGLDRIVATLPTIVSSRFEGGLFPIELANNIASLSTYPSARVLALFAEAAMIGASD